MLEPDEGEYDEAALNGNLVSGRPRYDDVSLINGSTIDLEAPEGRTCGPAEPLNLALIEPAGE